MTCNTIAMIAPGLIGLQAVRRMTREIDFMFLWSYIATNPNQSSDYERPHLTRLFRISAQEPAVARTGQQGAAPTDPPEIENRMMDHQWTTRCQKPMTPPR